MKKNLDAARIDGNLDLFAKKMVINAKSRASRNKWPFDLDERWVKEKLTAGFCEVTGLNFVFGDSSVEQKTNPWLPSLDRVDSKKGYTRENVRVVVWIYNQAKNEWTDEQFMQMVRALTKSSS